MLLLKVFRISNRSPYDIAKASSSTGVPDSLLTHSSVRSNSRIKMRKPVGDFNRDLRKTLGIYVNCFGVDLQRSTICVHGIQNQH